MKKHQPSAARTQNAAARRQKLQDAAADGAWAAPLEGLEPRQHMDAAAVQSLPFSLDFGKGVSGTVADRDGEGTGFTRVEANQYGTEYQPDKIDLDTANGVLKITSVGTAMSGSSGGTDNGQVNALETQFNGNQKGFSIETRLLGPFTTYNQRYDQAGIYFGPDQDNYVKLAIYRNWNGQYLGFEDEYSNATGGVYSQRNGTNAQTGVGSFSAINTLDLKIVGDASTGVVTAYYRINSDSGNYSTVGFTITVPTDKRSAFFNSASRAGIIAAHKNDIGPIVATFDSFAINAGTPVITQPTITAVTGIVDGATNVRRDPTITATITWPTAGGVALDASTLTSANVKLINAATGTAVACSLTLNAAGNAITVKPSSLLDPTTKYTLQITSGLKGTGSVAFVPYSASFTTTTADTAQPAIAVNIPTYYFSDISSTAATGGSGASNAQTVRITNTGTASLVIPSGGFTLTGANPGDFLLYNLPAGDVTLKPGQFMDLSFAFQATGVGIRTASISIASNDPNTPAATVALRGLGTAGEGGNLEPSLQRILDLYQIPINDGDATPDTTDFPATSVAADEIPIQLLQKAGAGDVTVQMLANFTNSLSPASIFGYYNPGTVQGRTRLFEVAKQYAQTVTPVITGTNTFDPGAGAFGLYGEFPAFAGRVVTSEKALNTWDTNTARQQKIRFYALKDANGNVVPNAYVFAFEEYGVTFDQNDIVGIIRNVKPADATATIGINNQDGVPFADRLVMSRIRDIQQVVSGQTYINNTYHDTSTLRITNTGTGALSVTGVTISNTDFTIVSGGDPFTLAPGATHDVVVKFVYNRTTDGNEVRTATMSIASNDPKQATKNVTLAGLWQSHSENNTAGVSMEPTAQTVLKAFGFNINDGKVNTAGAAIRAGEEVLSPWWQSANPSVSVGVRMLAAYHQEKSNTNSNIRYVTDATTAGTFLFQHLASDGQTVLPRKVNSTTAPAYGEFTTPLPFLFGVDSDYSLDSKNVHSYASGQHAMRFYAAKDAAGKIIPNTYVLMMDYVGQTYSNWDYQDNIYLISNVKPVSGPSTPAGLTKSATTSGINLSWAANTEGNLAGYNVYRSTSADGPFVKLNGSTITGTGYVDSTAVVGTTYTYRLVGVDYHGTESATPATIAASLSGDTVAPAAPSNASAVGSTSSVALTWLDNAEADLAGYNVYRASAINGTYVKLNGSTLTSSNYTDLNAPVAATSYYRITAVDTTGNESVAASVYAYRAAAGNVPAAPTGLTLGGATTSSVTLNWSDNSSDETAFLVERQNADGSFSQVATLAANVTTYTDTGLTSGGTYVYRVRAQNSTGPSAYTGTLSAATTLAAPTSPTTLVATALSANAVKLSWTDTSSTESGFRIERRLGTSGSWATIDTVNANIVSYVDGSASATTAYNYRVTAYNSTGTASSNVAAATTPAAAGFTSLDIGKQLSKGSTTVVSDGKDYDVTASGYDIWNASDSMRFVYRVVTGDFDYSVRIANIAQADPGSMAGLMARASLDANSANIMSRARMQNMTAGWRDTAGGSSSMQGGVNYTFPNAYVRLQRVGDSFTAYASTNGTTWTVLAQRTMSMPGTVYFGMCASARAVTTATMTAQFRDLTDRNAAAAPTAASALVGTVDPAGSSVALYWSDSAANETGYRVERRASDSSVWSTIATLGADTTTYTDAGLTGGTTYVYRVFAVNNAGDSAPTTELSVAVTTAAPDAPTSLVAANSDAGVVLNWSDASSNETGFSIERRVDGSSTWTVLGSVDSNVSTYTDTTAAAGTTYVYRVRATGAAGNSDYSAEASVTTPATLVYQSSDIGTSGGETQAVSDGSAYNVTASGADVWGTSDQFRFVYRQVTGNFDVRVRVSSLGYVVDNTMAGLMARATLDADSRQVYVKARTNGTTNMTSRGTSGGTTVINGSSAPNSFPDAWVRMTRSGNTFTTYTSTDGVTWTTLSSVTISMPSTMYVGMAVASHQAGTTTTATFDNLSLTTS